MWIVNKSNRAAKYVFLFLMLLTSQFFVDCKESKKNCHHYYPYCYRKIFTRKMEFLNGSGHFIKNLISSFAWFV